MDTEVESLSERVDKLQEKLESDIKILGAAAHDEIEEKVCSRTRALCPL